MSRTAQTRPRPRASPAPASPDDLDWLASVVRRSPLMSDPSLRRHWLAVLPWLEADGRYQLAAALLVTELQLTTTCPG